MTTFCYGISLVTFLNISFLYFGLTSLSLSRDAPVTHSFFLYGLRRKVLAVTVFFSLSHSLVIDFPSLLFFVFIK